MLRYFLEVKYHQILIDFTKLIENTKAHIGNITLEWMALSNTKWNLPRFVFGKGYSCLYSFGQ